MAYVVTRPCLIGHWRQPGEVLTTEELQGRSVHQMEELERTIRFDASIPEPASSKRPVEAPVEGGEGEDLSSLSLKDLKVIATEAGVENADKLRSKDAAVEAIEAARASAGEETDDESGSESEEGGEGEESGSEDESSSED